MDATGLRLTFRMLLLTDVDEAFAERWKELSDHALEPNPFHDPRFLLPSAQHREDARAIRLAVVEDERQLLAVLAFTLRKGFARMPVRMVSTLGPFMMQVGDLRHPLVSPTNPSQTWGALLRGLRSARLPGLLELANFPGGGPLADSLFTALGELGLPHRERERDERAFAHRMPNAASETAPLFTTEHSSSNTRKHRARHLRALVGAVGSELGVEDQGSNPEAIERFLDLEAAGWKGDAGREGHALRSTGHDTWFAAVADAFRADDRLTVCTLTAGPRTIYLGVGFRVGDGAFSALDTYDERLAPYSAGTFGRIAEWKHALSSPGVEFFDPNLSSVYRDSTRLYPHRRPHVTLLIATGGPLARLLFHSGPLARRLRSRIRPASGRGSGE